MKIVDAAEVDQTQQMQPGKKVSAATLKRRAKVIEEQKKHASTAREETRPER